MNFLMGQFFNFIAAIGIGLIIGILFDIYRGIWKKWASSSKTMPLWDVLWWLLVTVLVFFLLLNLNWGELRFYILLGQLIGFVFYLKRISPYFLRKFILFLYCLEKTIKRMILLILIPLKIIIRISVFPFMVLRLFYIKFKRIFKKVIWLVGLIFRAIPRKCKTIMKKFIKIGRNKK